MSKLAAGWLGFIGGLVLGYCVILFGWIAYTNIFDVFDREGGMIMGIVFFFAPIGGVVLGFIGAYWLTRRVSRGASETTPA